ncbi:MAG: SRPBCC family protein [Actinomycetota bacterium]|nr:SRPBCC family protein [Actinomycetota bacterium]
MTHRAVVTLPTDRQILITRDFDAPPALVFRGWTTPELVKRWWSGERGETTVADIDLRVGGRWRFVTATLTFEVGFHGEYREIVPDERLVFTEVFELVPDDYATVTLTLTPRGSAGGTAMRLLVEHTSTAARDMHVNSGMEGGMQESMSALEELASELGHQAGPHAHAVNGPPVTPGTVHPA